MAAMSAPRGLLKGPKFNGRHSTVINAAVPIVAALRRSDLVTKVVLSVIRPTKAARRRMKCVEIEAGLRLDVRGPNSVQTFYAYTRHPVAVMDLLARLWEPDHVPS